MSKLALILTILLSLSGLALAQQVTPQANSETPSVRPNIQAAFGQPIRNVKVLVDGVEFTANARVSGGTVVVTCPYNLDYGRHTVSISGLDLVGLPMQANWAFTIRAQNQNPPNQGGGATNYQPAPNTTAYNSQPTISVNFQRNVRNARFTVDGRDFSANSRVQNTTALMTPPYPLDNGTHSVQVEATNDWGQVERANWSFNIQAQAPPPPSGATSTSPTGSTRRSRPEIYADFPQQVRSAQVVMDGVNQGNGVGIQGNRVSLTPAQDLSNGRHTVTITAGYANGQTGSASWGFEVAGRDRDNNDSLTNLSPPPNAQIPQSRPFISADFPHDANAPKMWVDTQDCTGMAQINDRRISWTPGYDLSPGQHTVRVEGTSRRGQMMSGTWTFTIAGATPPPPVPPPGGQIVVNDPLPNSRVRDLFEVSGQAPPDSIVRIQLRTPPRGKVYTYKGQADETGAFQVPVSCKWAPHKGLVQVEVTPIDPDTGRRTGRSSIFNVVHR